MRAHRSATLVIVGIAGCACGETHAGHDASTLDTTHTPTIDAHLASDAPGPRLARDARHDFDGDGHADLVVGDPSHRGGRGAVWLVRAAEGGPLAPTLIAEGGPDEALGRFVFPVSDQDGDGRYEVGTYQSTDDRVWRGRWFGTRGRAGELPGFDLGDRARNCSLVMVDSVDLDRDPAPDVYAVYSCGGGGGGRPSYGQLELTAASVEDVPSRQNRWVVEVPGSPRRGLALFGTEGVVLRSEGSTRLLYEGDVSRLARVGDVDGDGEPDLLVQIVVGTSRTGEVYRSALLSLRPDGAVARDLPECAVGLGDWDCDGHDDLATGGHCSPSWGWWSAEGLPTAWLAGSASGPSTAEPLPADVFRGLTHPDLDLDGCRDEPAGWPYVAWPYSTAPVELARGRARARSTETWTLALPPTVDRARTFLAIDGDVWARSPYVAPPAFRHEGARVVPVETMPSETSSFGDVDGDGLEDAIEMVEGEAVFWRGRGDRFERTDLVIPVGMVGEAGLDAWIVGDVDGDGDAEVIASLPDGARGRRGGPAFPEGGVLVTLATPETLSTVRSLGDVDGDGREDLGGVGLRLHVWLARDLVAGATEVSASYARSGTDAWPGDVDGDGLTDLVMFVEWPGGVTSVAVHPGTRGAPPDPEPWSLTFSERPEGPLGPDGLILPTEPTGTSLLVRRITRAGLVEATTITVPVSVRDAHFQGPLLILPRAEEDGVHVYRVVRGTLEGPTVVPLPPGHAV